jgi:hypothetical protein
MTDVVKKSGGEAIEWNPLRAMRDLMQWDPFRELTQLAGWPFREYAKRSRSRPPAASRDARVTRHCTGTGLAPVDRRHAV